MFLKVTLAALHMEKPHTLKVHASLGCSCTFTVDCNVCKESVLASNELMHTSTDICATMYLVKSLNEFSIHGYSNMNLSCVCVSVFSTCSVRNFKRNQFTLAI